MHFAVYLNMQGWCTNNSYHRNDNYPRQEILLSNVNMSRTDMQLPFHPTSECSPLWGLVLFQKAAETQYCPTC